MTHVADQTQRAGTTPQVPCARGGVPLLGHLRQLLADPTGFLMSLPSYGDLVEIRLGTRRTLVVCGPELVSQVLVKDHRPFDKGGPFFENVAEFFGNGLATCPDAVHTRLRRLTQPVFRREQLAGYSDLVGREIEAVTGSWREGQVLDVYQVMQELAMRITVSTMFASWFSGSQAGSGAVRETLGHVDTLVSGAFVRMVAPGAARLPLPSNRRYEQARGALYGKIEETVAAYRRGGQDRGDLLSRLMAHDEGSKDALSDTEIRDQVMTMFIAGIGTTAAMLAWSLHYLSLDGDLDAEVAREAKAASSGPVALHDDLTRLPTLDKAVAETFRIRPAAWMFSRVTVTETVLGGYRIPAGSDVLISPYILHHRPDLFTDPDRFDPQRWDDVSADWARAERAAMMIPFGTGFRKCIGRDFSVMNITLTLASILKTWKLTPATTASVTLQGRSIIEPRGLALRLQRRQFPLPRQGEAVTPR